jgi:hypothetical protein
MERELAGHLRGQQSKRDSSNNTHSIMNFILADCASSSETEVEVMEGGSSCMGSWLTKQMNEGPSERS